MDLSTVELAELPHAVNTIATSATAACIALTILPPFTGRIYACIGVSAWCDGPRAAGQPTRHCAVPRPDLGPLHGHGADARCLRTDVHQEPLICSGTVDVQTDYQVPVRTHVLDERPIARCVAGVWIVNGRELPVAKDPSIRHLTVPIRRAHDGARVRNRGNRCALP